MAPASNWCCFVMRKRPLKRASGSHQRNRGKPKIAPPSVSVSNHRPIDMDWQDFRLICLPSKLAPSKHNPIGQTQRQNQRCRKSTIRPVTSPRPRIGWIVFVARIDVMATKGLNAGTSGRRAIFSPIGKRNSTTTMRQTKRTSNLK